MEFVIPVVGMKIDRFITFPQLHAIGQLVMKSDWYYVGEVIDVSNEWGNSRLVYQSLNEDIICSISSKVWFEQFRVHVEGTKPFSKEKEL